MPVCCIVGVSFTPASGGVSGTVWFATGREEIGTELNDLQHRACRPAASSAGSEGTPSDGPSLPRGTDGPCQGGDAETWLASLEKSQSESTMVLKSKRREIKMHL